jgi:hypothetical protein
MVSGFPYSSVSIGESTLAKVAKGLAPEVTRCVELSTHARHVTEKVSVNHLLRYGRGSCIGPVGESKMKDLIEALTILMKYSDGEVHAPTHCEHDIFLVAGCGIGRETIPDDDAEKLLNLGFHWSSEYDCWASFRFGSC